MNKESREIEVTELAGIIRSKIVESVIPTISQNLDYDQPTDSVEFNGGEVTIIFADGSSLTSWNSEWGGLVYKKGKQKLSPTGELSNLEIDMKIANTQPSPDSHEYLRRIVRQIEPLIRFKERQRIEYEQSKGK